MRFFFFRVDDRFRAFRFSQYDFFPPARHVLKMSLPRELIASPLHLRERTLEDYFELTAPGSQGRNDVKFGKLRICHLSSSYHLGFVNEPSSLQLISVFMCYGVMLTGDV